MAREMKYCPVCGNSHAEIADCPKYGVNVCGAHCEICEYRLGNLPISGGSCGYNASAMVLKIPQYPAPMGEVAEEITKYEDWDKDKLEKYHQDIKESYKETFEPLQRAKMRVKLAATQKLLRDIADDVIAETHIPQMKTERLMEYRSELCRRLASLEYNARLKRALLKALELCRAELDKRGV